MPLTSSEQEVRAWLAMTLTPGLSGSGVRALLQRFGSPEAVLAQSLTALTAVLDRELAQRLLDSQRNERVDATLRWLEQDGNHLVVLGEPEYPRLLLECGDPPSVLYVKGRRELLNAQALAVVGSRNPTPQGVQNAERFSQSLSLAGLTIVSGLALGIDAAAHKGALAGTSSSLAVVGTGLDIVYPARNRELAHRLAQEGALVSEFPLGTPGLAGNFPRRNRIISGLSLGCLVVEAAIASGSLITARLAGEQGRDIFAIPGSIHSPLSKGCHQLIKQGAKLVESAEDVLAELGMGADAVRAVKFAPPAVDDKDELLRAMGHDPVSVDELSMRCNLPAEEIQGRLLQLELSGHIAVMPGGRVQRLA